MTLGERIKAIRKGKNISLKQLSLKIGISISFLSDIENGRSNPSLQRLKDISEGLGTTVSYLLGEQSAMAGEFEEEYTKSGFYTKICKNDYLDEGNMTALLDNPELRNILSYFSDFKTWNNEDKKELVSYLRIKHMIRKFDNR